MIGREEERFNTCNYTNASRSISFSGMTYTQNYLSSFLFFGGIK